MKVKIPSVSTPSILMNKLHDPMRIKEGEQEWLEAIENIYAALDHPAFVNRTLLLIRLYHFNPDTIRTFDERYADAPKRPGLHGKFNTV